VSYEIKWTARACEDLDRLYTYMLDRDEEAAGRAYDAIVKAMAVLQDFPFSCRKASDESSVLRELIVSFGSAGYVVLFKIEDSKTVIIAALRHQREDDYH
jgi:plasmid stabilization system protein ParE